MAKKETAAQHRKRVKKEMQKDPDMGVRPEDIAVIGDIMEDKRAKEIAKDVEKCQAQTGLDYASARLLVRAIKLRESFIERMIDIVPNERNLNALSFGLKTLHEILTGTEARPEDTNESMIDKINKQCSVKNKIKKRKRNEQESNDSGDIQDATIVS
jgi:hypothetical protein